MNALREFVQSSAIYKALGIGLLWLALALVVYDAIENPRSVARRAVISYCASLDTRFRSMAMPPRGAAIAWFQGCGALALVAVYALVQVREFLLAAAVVIVLPSSIVNYMVKRRLQQIGGQVHGFALALANALKTTASIGEALWVTVSVTPVPLKGELETALKEVKVGSALDEALLAMSFRAQSKALDTVVSALLIGRQTGGDLPRILEGTSASLREIVRLEELTEKVTRDARLSLFGAAVMTAGTAIFMPKVMPGFFDPVYNTPAGQMFAVQCAAVYVFALFLGFRLARMDV